MRRRATALLLAGGAAASLALLFAELDLSPLAALTADRRVARIAAVR